MKICSHCKQEKTLEEFNRRGSGYRADCKDCRKKKGHNKKKRKRDPHFTVYYLPEHHYVGMTNSLKSRMLDHKKNGKIVYGHEVVSTFSNAIEAHLFETILHRMGYNGFHYKSKTSKNE